MTKLKGLTAPLIQTGVLESDIATRQNMQFLFNFFNYLPDPDEVLSQNGNNFSVYEKLLLDGRVSSSYEQRFAESLALTPSIDCEDADKKELLENWLKHIGIRNILNEIILSIHYGTTLLECVWKREGADILPSKIESKPREWLAFDNYNVPVLKREDGTLIEMPDYKFLIVQNKPSYKNPYGTRLAAKLFWYVTFKRGGVKLWVKFIEKYGMPHAYAKVPDVKKAIADGVLEQLNLMVQDACGVLPSNAEIEIHDRATNSNAGDNYSRFLRDFCNDEITEIILTQTLTSGNEGVGSYALGKIHSDKLQNVIQHEKQLAIDTINRLLSWIGLLNWNDPNVATFSLSEKQQINKEVAERDNTLSNLIVFKDKKSFAERHSLNEDEFEFKAESKPQVNPFQDQQIPPLPSATDKSEDDKKEFAESKKQLASMFTELDKYAERLLKEPAAIQAFELQTDPVFALISSSKDYSEVLKKLETIFPNMDKAEQARLLTNAYFVMSFLGRESVKGN